MAIEVWSDGDGGNSTFAATGGGEPEAQATGGGSHARQGHAPGGAHKKVVRPARKREWV